MGEGGLLHRSQQKLKSKTRCTFFNPVHQELKLSSQNWFIVSECHIVTACGKLYQTKSVFRNHIHSHLHSISWQGLHTTAFASQDQWAINLQTFPPLLLYQCTLRHALRGKFLRPNGSKPKSAFWWSLIRRLWFSYSLGQSVWCLYYLVLHRYFSAANLCKRSPEGFSMSRPQFSSPEYIYLSGVIEVDGWVCHFDNEVLGQWSLDGLCTTQYFQHQHKRTAPSRRLMWQVSILGAILPPPLSYAQLASS